MARAQLRLSAVIPDSMRVGALNRSASGYRDLTDPQAEAGGFF